MTDIELEHLYFEWLYRLVCDDRYGGDRSSYRRLLTYLHHTDYRYETKPPHDDVRSYDGIDMRYEFGYEAHVDSRLIASVLDVRPCSMLEMMVALCFRCESIAADKAKGDRIGQWFWAMLHSLGLAGMNDLEFDQSTAEDILERFFKNEYARNGEGGLFTLHNTNEDCREKEIWWQMCRFLNENGL